MIDTYFDWAATAIPNPAIIEEAMDIFLKNSANPSSIHRAGKNARTMIEEARSRIASVFGVKSETLIFTAGGTEANAIPLLSILTRPTKGSIIISGIEHSAVARQAEILQTQGIKIISVPPDTRGFIQPETLLHHIQQDTVMVCVMAVNNETGAIQPIKAIAEAIRTNNKTKRTIHFHVDAVQAIGKIPFNIAELGITSFAMSSHKICGTKGAGLLYTKEIFNGFLKGGGQEQGLRNGTENLLGIWALMRAIETYAEKNAIQKNIAEQINKTNFFIKELQSLQSCTIIPEQRTTQTIEDEIIFSPWIIQASFKNIPAEVMVRALSEKNYYISAGSACNATKNTRSVLAAMKIPKAVAQNTVRSSFGVDTKKSAIQNLITAIKEVVTVFTL